jgi:hypothetical protein
MEVMVVEEAGNTEFAELVKVANVVRTEGRRASRAGDVVLWFPVTQASQRAVRCCGMGWVGGGGAFY